MKFCRATVTFILSLFCASGLFAYNASDLVSASSYAKLQKDGVVQVSHYKEKGAKLSLVPNTPAAKEAYKMWTSDEEPVFLGEHLYLIPKSKLNASNPESVTIDAASKIVRSVSKMQGMTYYSHRSKKVKTLYESAYCIKGPKDRTRVADNTEGNANGKVLYAMLDDASFGKTNYRMEYTQNAQEVALHFINETGLSVMGISAVSKNNMHIKLVITDCGDSVMVYMAVMAKFPGIKMLEQTMNESFVARLDSIYTWFCKQF